MKNKFIIACFLLILFSPICLAQYPQILWQVDLDAPSFGSAAVADIDNDNYPEIVFGTYFNDEKVYALNAEDGSELWSFNTSSCNDASPVIYDVDLDGQLEVIIPASATCIVYCFNGADGTVEWTRNTGHCMDSPPSIADVDNDQKPEIVVGTFQGYVFCLNGENGSIQWQVNLGPTSAIESCPNIVDLDNDGQLDIVVAQWAGDYRIYALKGDSGTELWHSDLPSDHLYHGGSFADLDQDNKPEIVIGCYDSKVYCLNGEDGSLNWNYPCPFYVGSPTSLGDLNQDGLLEVVFASYSTIYALTSTGSFLWDYSTGGNVFRGVALADVDGDDSLDVIFGSDDGYLRAVKGYDGSLNWQIDLQSHYQDSFEIDHAPVIADFDLDGKLDVFIVGGYVSNTDSNHGRAYALTAGGGNGPGWTMFRHDHRRSGCFQGFPGGVEEGPVQINHQSSNFNIQPFSTDNNLTVDFTITQEGMVELKLYDLSGKLIKLLISHHFQPGKYTEQFNLEHFEISSGLYLVQLNQNDQLITKKFIYLD